MYARRRPRRAAKDCQEIGMSQEYRNPRRKIISSDMASVSISEAIDGTFVALPPKAKLAKGVVTDDSLSIDVLMRAGLTAINRTLHSLLQDINAASPNSPSRETIQSLKDVMAMLRDLKKDEKDLLDTMSDEELEKLASK